MLAMARRRRGQKGTSRKSSRTEKLLATGIVLALLIIIFYLFWARPATQQKIAQKQPPRHEDTTLEAKKPKFEKHVSVAIIIDDLGQDINQARAILSLGSGITLSVMPGLPHSREIALLAAKNGNNVLLHLPMERNGHSKKPEAWGTIRSDMTPAEFIEAVRRNIDSVPYAKGVNNHEGSALTENNEAMKFLMAELKAHDLFFIDSLTSPRSIAFATAKEFGLKAGRRDVFLDNNTSDPKAIRSQLAKLVAIAKRRGWAIGIGHPHQITISELKKWTLAAEDIGIKIVPVSQLIR